MTKGLWIWKNKLTDVLTTISNTTDIELTSSSVDEIKYGLVGTSDEKGNWFDYRIGNVTLRLAMDNDDNDIVHLETTGLDDKTISILSDVGTKIP